VVGGATTEGGGAVVGAVVEGGFVVGAATVTVDAILIGGPVVDDAFVPVAPEQPANRTAMAVAASNDLRTGGLI
jgi:hypothetical protein